MNRKFRNVPFFPFLPFAPLLLASGLFTLDAIILRRLRRLTRSIEVLTHAAEAQPA
jgi:hypothetical protein